MIMQTNVQPDPTLRDETTVKLEECLRTEVSAVETYELALGSIEHVGMHHTLQEILTNHARRAERISERLSSLGAELPKSSGARGAFAKVVQTGADALGARVAIDALEAGEDRALKLYSSGFDHCDAKTRSLVADLLTEQQRTHELCRTLKQFVHRPS
jgi:Domain of unknown function (DUF2383)